MAYSSKASVRHGATSVQANCEDPSRFDRTATEGGKFRFNLKAKNNQVIGTSKNYDSEASLNAGISAVANAARGAEIVDLSETA